LTIFRATQLSQFDALLELYRDWNQKINVISRKDIDALYPKACAAFIEQLPLVLVLKMGNAS
jgi:16S rRNA G527 N7-methylase RsmG